MSIAKAIFLGIVQGITEFLPISSDGHLTLFGQGEESFGLYTVVFLHFGTLMAIMLYYGEDLWKSLFGGFRVIGRLLPARGARPAWGEFLREDKYARLALLITIGTIPTGIIGIALKEFSEYAMSPGHIRIVGAMFILTGILVYLSDRFPASTKGIAQATAKDFVVMGIFQGFAVLPGLSRSGSTIFAGAMSGMDRREVARMSFLMSVPAVMGATLVATREGGHTGDLLPAIVGAAVALVTGYAALTLLVKMLASRKLSYFTSYLIALGVFVLLWR